jgi:hypothetical protein
LLLSRCRYFPPCWHRSRNLFLWIRNMFGEVELFIPPWCGCSVT